MGNEIAIINADLCIPLNIEDTYKRILIQQSNNSCRYEFKANDALTTFDINPNKRYEIDGSIGVWIQPGHTPGLYYKLMNLFIFSNSTMSIILMRLINSLIFCVLLVSLLIIADEKVFNSTLIAISLTLIPHGLFLTAGITTASWAYIGCALNWSFLFILLHTKFRLRLANVVSLLGWVITLAMVLASRFEPVIYIIFSSILLIGLKILGPKIFSPSSLLICAVMGLIIFEVLRSQSLGFRSLFAQNSFYSNQISDLIIVFGNALKISIATPLRLLGLQPPGWLYGTLPLVILFSGLLLSFATLSNIFDKKNKMQQKFLILSSSFIFLIILSQTFTRRNWTTPFYLIRTSWTSDQFFSRYFLPVFPFIIGMTSVLSNQLESLFDQSKFKNLIIIFLTFSHSVVLYEISDIFRENPTWYWQSIPLSIEFIYLAGSLTFFFFLYLTFNRPRQTLACKFQSQ